MDVPPRPLLAFALALSAVGVHAQSMCSSDGQPRPAGLLERFINADCESCWSDAHAPRPGRGALALDWIVPGHRGAEAPLAVAARREAADRLAAVRAPMRAGAAATHQKIGSGAGQLRVVRGLRVNDYIGTAIELRGAPPGRWRAWLLLVETIPAGSEGTPVERNLVRNVLQLDWNVGASRTSRRPLAEDRPMQIPEGAQPARLRVVGWVQDARGRIKAIAQSSPRCDVD